MRLVIEGDRLFMTAFIAGSPGIETRYRRKCRSRPGCCKFAFEPARNTIEEESNMLRRIARMLTVSCCVLAIPALAAQATYPLHPIRIIVPFPPGGSTDVIARLVGQKLTEAWGQQVVVDNRSGAGGNIGMGLAAHANPDGYP